MSNKRHEALRLAEDLETLRMNTATNDQAAAELRRLHAVNQELVAALQKLACLGNGDRYGNSDGNCIAQAALAKAQGYGK